MARLPKGLAEFEASLPDPEYAGELVPRLLDLPENGLMADVERHRELLAEVRKAEQALAAARRTAAAQAEKVWKRARANWTIKELQAATGYTDE